MLRKKVSVTIILSVTLIVMYGCVSMSSYGRVLNSEETRVFVKAITGYDSIALISNYDREWNGLVLGDKESFRFYFTPSENSEEAIIEAKLVVSDKLKIIGNHRARIKISVDHQSLSYWCVLRVGNVNGIMGSALYFECSPTPLQYLSWPLDEKYY